jgi:hypothetical protein
MKSKIEIKNLNGEVLFEFDPKDIVAIPISTDGKIMVHGIILGKLKR